MTKSLNSERRQKREYLLNFQVNMTLKGYTLAHPHRISKCESTRVLPIGEGGSGVVFLAIQELHEGVSIDRAIKFFIYRDDIAELTKHRYAGPVSKKDFLSEIKNISTFNHENLVKVVDAGIYESDGVQIPYIVTEFINGPTLKQVITSKNGNHKPPLAYKLVQELSNAPVKILELLLQISYGLQHIHQHGFAHCDIAPKNIFLDTNQNIRPVIGDLGISKELKRSRDEVFVSGSKQYMPEEAKQYLNTVVNWETFKTLHPHWDLYSFAQTGLELIDSFPSCIDFPWGIPLRTTLQRIGKSSKYNSIDDIIERIEFLRPIQREVAAVPELSASVAGKARKLMPVEPLSLSKRVRKIIRHPALVRLAKVPQLTTAYQLFPGAMHTRYEHSLGVMETVRRYLIALLDQSEFLEHLTIEKIETALLAGLFYNLTRFPLSNIVHEIRQKNRQILDLFTKNNLLKEIWSIENNLGRTIGDVLGEYFPYVKQERLRLLLPGKTADFDDEEHLIHSFLNCSLDARVIDFVRRDSLQLGIIKGDTFDLDELLPHFTIYNHRLALRTTGVPLAEQVISLRYWLFNRIYWNRPIRSFCSMVRHVILRLAKDEKFSVRMRERVLRCTERELLLFFLDEAKNSKEKGLIDICERLCADEQSLYRVVFDVSQKDNADLKSVCLKIGTMDYIELEDLARKLEKKINFFKSSRVEQSRNNLLLIDIPYEPGSNKLGDDIVVKRSDGEIANLTEFSGIISGINESFDTYIKRLRVLIHPDIYPNKEEERKEISAKIHDILFRMF